jgi:hypothetical protein
VKRADWQKLAEEREKDAKVLLDGGQWAAAYYLAGYAIESGLKSCVLAYVEKNADIIYRERKYSENCWTHDIGTLVQASGLDVIRLAEANANPDFGVNWGQFRSGARRRVASSRPTRMQCGFTKPSLIMSTGCCHGFESTGDRGNRWWGGADPKVSGIHAG